MISGSIELWWTLLSSGEWVKSLCCVSIHCLHVIYHINLWSWFIPAFDSMAHSTRALETRKGGRRAHTLGAHQARVKSVKKLSLDSIRSTGISLSSYMCWGERCKRATTSEPTTHGRGQHTPRCEQLRWDSVTCVMSDEISLMVF